MFTCTLFLGLVGPLPKPPRAPKVPSFRELSDPQALGMSAHGCGLVSCDHLSTHKVPEVADNPAFITGPGDPWYNKANGEHSGIVDTDSIERLDKRHIVPVYHIDAIDNPTYPGHNCMTLFTPTELNERTYMCLEDPHLSKECGSKDDLDLESTSSESNYIMPGAPIGHESKLGSREARADLQDADVPDETNSGGKRTKSEETHSPKLQPLREAADDMGEYDGQDSIYVLQIPGQGSKTDFATTWPTKIKRRPTQNGYAQRTLSGGRSKKKHSLPTLNEEHP